MSSDVESLVSAFKDKDLGALKTFITQQVAECENYEQFSKITYCLWIVTQSRCKPKPKAYV